VWIDTVLGEYHVNLSAGVGEALWLKLGAVAVIEVVSIDTPSAFVLQTLDITVTTVGAAEGDSISFGSGITTNSTTFVSETELTANITVNAGASQGLRSCVLTRGARTATLANCFTVTDSVDPLTLDGLSTAFVASANALSRVAGTARVFAAASQQIMTCPTDDLWQIGTSDATISLFVRLAAVNVTAWILDTVGSGNKGFQLFHQNAATKCYVGDGSTTILLTGPNVSAGEFAHVLVDLDRDGNGTIYVNNSAGTPTSIAAVGSMNTGNLLCLGGYKVGAGAASDWMSGRVAQVVIAKRRWTEAERTWVYNAGAGRMAAELGVAGNDGADLLTDLAAYWDCGATSGNETDAINSLVFTDVNSVGTDAGPGAQVETPASNGNTISVWGSSAVDATEVTQATADKQPLWYDGAEVYHSAITPGIGGHPALYFDGTDDLLRVASAYLTGTNGTVFFVIKPTTMTGGRFVLTSGDEGGSYQSLNLGLYGAKANILHLGATAQEDQVTGSDTFLANQRYVVEVNSSGTAWSIVVNDATQTLTVNDGANSGDWLDDAANKDAVAIGASTYNTEQNFFAGYISAIYVFTPALAAAYRLAVRTWLSDTYGTGAEPDTRYYLCADGSSITTGDGGTPGNSWPSQCVSALGANWYADNLGVSGQGVAEMLVDAVSQVDALYNADHTLNIAVAEGLTNDIYYGLTAQVAYDNLKSYCQGRTTAGFSVIALDCLPRSQFTVGDREARRLAVNALLAADFSVATSDSRVWLPGPGITYASRLVKMSLHPNLDDYSDETYYADGVHPTDAGALAIASDVKLAIDQIVSE